MAKIELIHEASEHRPASTETIEVHPWDLGGRHNQPFYIGSGLNYRADQNIWLEIIYSVEGAQIFYTRNFLHHAWGFELNEQLERLQKLSDSGEGVFGFGDMLPETGLTFKVEKKSYQSQEGAEPQYYQVVTLKIFVDTGAVFGFSAPGNRFVEIRLDLESIEGGARFMRELVHELDAVFQGKHPDPACFPAGSCEWPLVWQLNRRAYNELADSYQEDYFTNPLLADAFAAWLAQLPAGGQVLDTGCGHGDPVITKLLERGFHVTGADFSPEMLKKAREQFPQVNLVQQAATQLNFEAAFDGACSFSSLLYLDPIDFFNAVYRLNHALKPGGLLFLYGFDPGPDWRGEPFNIVIGKWMWGWHYSMEEAAGRLEEHGSFQVVEYKRVWWDEEKEQEIAQKMEAEKEREADHRRKMAENPGQFLPYSSALLERPPYAYVIVARQVERPEKLS
jgi:SAM-dependent methyltransferase